MSRVEVQLSTGHTATIEFDDGDMTSYILGEGPLPEHPDEQATRTLREIVDAMADDDVKVIGVHMVTAKEEAEEVAENYRKMARRMIEREK